MTLMRWTVTAILWAAFAAEIAFALYLVYMVAATVAHLIVAIAAATPGQILSSVGVIGIMGSGIAAAVVFWSYLMGDFGLDRQ